MHNNTVIFGTTAPAANITCTLAGLDAKSATGRSLTAPAMGSYDTFAAPTPSSRILSQAA